MFRKRIVSIVLCLVLLFTVFPANFALAEGPGPANSPIPADAMGKSLSGFGSPRSPQLEAAPVVLLPDSTINFLQDGSFEASYGTSAYWSQSSTYYGTPLCNATDCSAGPAYGYSRPHTGNIWAWFGGASGVTEEGSLQQSLTIPSGPATLRFYLWITTPQPGFDAADNLVVTMDGTNIFMANATQQNLYKSYTLVAVDVSAYADGGVHTLRMDSNTSDQFVNFSVDDISINQATFGDVAPDHWAWSYIEKLAANGVTSGCNVSPKMYCPAGLVTRAQMAVFLLRAEHGLGYTPPTATGVFADVPVGYWAADWIEQLALEGITSGCSVTPKRYCPESAVTRDQMAVFLLRAEHGSTYAPPAATGVFADVPGTFWAAGWIEQLALEGVTTGCSASPKLYCPLNPVARDQMAVFLVRTFSLP